MYFAPGPNIRTGNLGTSSSQASRSQLITTSAAAWMYRRGFLPASGVISSGGSAPGIQSTLDTTSAGHADGYRVIVNSSTAKISVTHAAVIISTPGTRST